jgi:hypothetical protein
MQDVGNSFLRGYYNSREHMERRSTATSGSSSIQPFMVADQSNPGFKEDLMRCVCVYGLVCGLELCTLSVAYC